MSIRAIRWAMGLFEHVDLPPQERNILLVICYHHNDKTGDCFPSNDTIAKLSGYRKRRVIDGIANLKKWGLVTVEKRRVNGRQGSNQISLFGSYKPASRVPPSARSQGAQKSTLARVPPSAHDRGYIYITNSEGGNVAPFPSQTKKAGGRDV